jgi:tetratricopeptide (TPR) repeat protein
MREPAFRLLFFVLLVIQLSLFNFAQTKPEQASQRLEQGKPIERELKGGDVHAYSIPLTAGQFCDLIVEQRGIDVVVTLSGPDGKQVMEVDSPNGTQGTEPVSFVAKSSGSYRLEVRSLEKEAATARYEVRIAALREATVPDKTGDLATTLIAAKTDDERAALLAREKDLVTQELPVALSRKAVRLYNELADYPKALPVLQLAQSIAEKIGDKTGIFDVQNHTANVYRFLGNYAKAQELHEKNLTLAEAMGYKNRIFNALFGLGSTHYFQGQLTQALELFRQALPITPMGNKRPLSLVLISIGNVYNDQGSYPQALEYYKKSLVLSEELKDKPNIAGTLNNIGMVYHQQGNYTQALENLLRGLKLREEMGNKTLIAYSAINIGGLHNAFGIYALALDYFQQSKALHARTHGKRCRSFARRHYPATSFLAP